MEEYRGLLFNNYKNVILTPNAMEFRRLWINHILKENCQTFDAKKHKDKYIPVM